MQAERVTRSELYNRQATRRIRAQYANVNDPLSSGNTDELTDWDIAPTHRSNDPDNRERYKACMRRLLQALNGEAVA